MNIQSFRALAGKPQNAYVNLQNNKLSVVKSGRAYTQLQTDGTRNKSVRNALFAALTQGLNATDSYVNRLRSQLLGEGARESALSVRELNDYLVEYDNTVVSMRAFDAALDVDPELFAPDAGVDTDLGGLDLAAARHATGIFKASALGDLLPLDKLSAVDRAAFEKHAGDAERALRKLYALTQQDLKDAANDTDKNRDLDGLVAQARDALLDLGDLVRRVLNGSEVQSEGLLKLMDYCYARATEVMQVVSEARVASDERNGASVAELVAEASLKMHGADAFRTAVGAKVTALTQRLRTLEADKKAVCRNAEAASLREDLVKLQEQLKKAAEHGIAVGNDRTAGRFVPERSLVDAYLGTLADTLRDLDELLAADYTKLAQELVKDFFPDGAAGQKRYPADWNLAKVCREALLGSLTKTDLGKFDMKVFDRLEQKVQSKDHEKLHRIVGFLKSQLKSMKQATNGGVSIPAGLMSKFLSGKIGVGTLVGALANGFGPDQVDERLDDRFLVSQELLGEGQASKVYKLTYAFPDGTTETRVFKPETDARVGIQQLALGKTGYADTTRAAHLNIATARSAALLGVPHLADDITIGMHGGQIGFFMKLAPGMDLKKADAIRRTARQSPKLGLLSSQAIVNRTRLDVFKSLAGLQRSLCELEWLDWMTGQMDRHCGNYLVDLTPGKTHCVKAIDNDGSFPAYRVGLYKYRLTGTHLENTLKNLGLKSADELRKTYPDRITEASDGVLVLDVENDPKLMRKVSVMVFGCNSASRPKRITATMYQKLMDLDAKASKDPDALRKAAEALFVKDMATAGQLDATVARLKEMIEHAKRLKVEDGKIRAENTTRDSLKQKGNLVVADDEWAEGGQASGIILGQRDTEVALKKGLATQAKTAEEVSDVYYFGNDYFTRDIFQFLPRRLLL